MTISEIEDKIAANEMTVAQVFTQMREQVESDTNLAGRVLVENGKLRKACKSASRLIGMNEDGDSMKACRILDRAIIS